MHKTRDEVRELLELLLELTDVPVRFSGSLLRPTLHLIGDVLSHLQEFFLFSSQKPIPRNPGLKFLEETPSDEMETDTFVDDKERALEGLFFPSLLEDGEYDPVNDNFYNSQSDPLGNPLQVSINLDENLLLSRRDIVNLANFFEKLQEVFVFLADGRIDFRFIRSIRRLFSRKSPVATKSNHKNVEYFKRKHKKRSPSKSKNNK
jgi:hypothetical protein